MEFGRVESFEGRMCLQDEELESERSAYWLADAQTSCLYLKDKADLSSYEDSY